MKVAILATLLAAATSAQQTTDAPGVVASGFNSVGGTASNAVTSVISEGVNGFNSVGSVASSGFTSIVQVVSSAILGDNAAPNMRLDVNGQLILGLGAGLSALIGAGAIML